ncbi:MAG: ribonuclease P protein component [Microbacteriaceae bacterium]|nr:ribonuclease P protein component [Microbacteriaceae bacterium]
MATQLRVKRGTDFRRIVRSKTRVGGKFATAHAVFLSPEAAPVFGFIITKAVGKAVVRNKVRRRFRAICDTAIRNGFCGAEVVFRIFPHTATAEFAEIERATLHQLQKITALREKTPDQSGFPSEKIGGAAGSETSIETDSKTDPEISATNPATGQKPAN